MTKARHSLEKFVVVPCLCGASWVLCAILGCSKGFLLNNLGLYNALATLMIPWKKQLTHCYLVKQCERIVK